MQMNTGWGEDKPSYLGAALVPWAGGSPGSATALETDEVKREAVIPLLWMTRP